MIRNSASGALGRHVASFDAPQRGLLRILLLVTAVFAVTMIGLGGWALGRGADRTLLLSAVALAGACALAFGCIAAVALLQRPRTPPGSAPAPSPAFQRPDRGAFDPHEAADSPNRRDPSGWTSLWPGDADPAAAKSMSAGAEARLCSAATQPPPAAVADDGLLRRAEGLTAATGALIKEAEELNACSLDLSTLANGTMRKASDADEAVRTAYLDVASALLEAAREAGTDRAGRHEIENCLIHAGITRQLLGQFLALATLGAQARREGHGVWQDDAPDLAALAQDCLQAADAMARLAADSRAHFQAAEAASSARMESLQSLAAGLHELSTTSAVMLQMNRSQMDYGNSIAHLASRLAVGTICLNDDLQQAFRAE